LTSASAIEFFDTLPKAEQMMPALAMPAIQEILKTRKAAIEAERSGYGYHRIERDYGIESRRLSEQDFIGHWTSP
jgi:hypothetical protein